MNNKCKYIIVDTYDMGELAYVFSYLVKHDAVAEAVAPGAAVVGAGFCKIVDNKFECFGSSISLKVASNGQVDSDIINRQLGLDN